MTYNRKTPVVIGPVLAPVGRVIARFCPDRFTAYTASIYDDEDGNLYATGHLSVRAFAGAASSWVLKHCPAGCVADHSPSGAGALHTTPPCEMVSEDLETFGTLREEHLVRTWHDVGQEDEDGSDRAYFVRHPALRYVLAAALGLEAEVMPRTWWRRP